MNRPSRPRRIIPFCHDVLKQTAVRLTLSLLVSVVAIVVFLSAFSYRHSVQVLEAESAANSLQTIIQTNRHIENVLKQYTEMVESLANDQTFKNKLAVLSSPDADAEMLDMSQTRIANLLESYAVSNRQVASITVLSADQSRVVSSLPIEARIPTVRDGNAGAIRGLDWFRAIRESDRDLSFLDTRRDAFVSASADQPMFAVALRIRASGSDRDWIGTLVAEVPAGVLETALNGLVSGPSDGYVMFDREGTIVNASMDLLLGTDYRATAPEWDKLSGETEGSFYAPDDRGRVQRFSFQRSDVSDWTLVGFRSRDELLGPMRRMLANSVVLSCIFCLLAAFIVGFLMHRGVGRPLRKLRLLMQEGEHGNLSVRTDFKSASEIGELGLAFNRMMDQISLAYYDTLTNLPNRRLLVKRLEEWLPQAAREGTQVAVLFVDLDRFKIVNDTLGHQAGDRLIQLVGLRLQECMPQADTLARIAGDEFVAVLREIDRETPQRIAELMLERLREPFEIAGQTLHLTGSVGIALYPCDAPNVEALVKCADIAMYEAKAKGKNRLSWYHRDMSDRTNERLRIENDLHAALERGEFELYYQPRMNARTGKLTGCEALIRWNHPSMGRIPPDKFIPVAEETGLIVPLGEWVLREACRQNRAWMDAGLPAVRVAVNVSAGQLDGGFMEKADRILRETRLSGDKLEIEITERVLLESDEAINETLRGLKARDIRLAIDDFGTGYSNLAFLLKFQVDTLKLDRSFVSGLPTNADNQTIASAIIQLAHNLGMSVTAEGAETLEEVNYLSAQGADEIQGYYYGAPFPASEFERLLRRG